MGVETTVLSKDERQTLFQRLVELLTPVVGAPGLEEPHPIWDQLRTVLRANNLPVECSFTAKDRMRLWAHLVSKHAACISPDMGMTDLIDLHQHEHNGPGGIRNHPEDSREFSLPKMGEVLSESDGK